MLPRRAHIPYPKTFLVKTSDKETGMGHESCASHSMLMIERHLKGEIIKQFDAHTNYLYSLSIAPNGTKFATTSYDKTTWFFDLITSEPIGEPLEHPDEVYGVAFSEDSQLVATGCKDHLVRTRTVPLNESEKESQQVSKLSFHVMLRIDLSIQTILKVRFHPSRFVRFILSCPSVESSSPRTA